MDLGNLRKDYQTKNFRKKDLPSNPFVLFENWLVEAVEANAVEPNAMALSTATKEGAPSCRMVLLKHFEAQGFYFYTSYESRKAKELLENPRAVLTFWWKELERQVIIEGKPTKTTRENSEKYFKSRPVRSQLSAFVSHQDRVVNSRDELEDAYRMAEDKFSGKEVPLPDHWGGFCLNPHRFEFWQGSRDRLHDRFQYTFDQGFWAICRLSP